MQNVLSLCHLIASFLIKIKGVRFPVWTGSFYPCPFWSWIQRPRLLSWRASLLPFDHKDSKQSHIHRHQTDWKKNVAKMNSHWLLQKPLNTSIFISRALSSSPNNYPLIPRNQHGSSRLHSESCCLLLQMTEPLYIWQFWKWWNKSETAGRVQALHCSEVSECCCCLC